MFELRTIPVHLPLCALVLAIWIAVMPGSQAPAVGWAFAGMLALYAVSTVVLRSGRSERSVAHALDEAAQVNAARVAPRRSHQPRRDEHGTEQTSLL
jgi:hypothetical protein